MDKLSNKHRPKKKGKYSKDFNKTANMQQYFPKVWLLYPLYS